MRRVVAHWRAGAFTAVSSPATRAELADVLSRPHIRRLAAEPLDELARGVERFTEHVPGELTLQGLCRDAKDDKFLACGVPLPGRCAVEGNVHYLVSSDRDLLDMVRVETVAIVNPGQFLVAVELYSMDPPTMLGRFGRQALAGIQSTMPLEPATAARIADALANL